METSQPNSATILDSNSVAALDAQYAQLAAQVDGAPAATPAPVQQAPTPATQPPTTEVQAKLEQLRALQQSAVVPPAATEQPVGEQPSSTQTLPTVPQLPNLATLQLPSQDALTPEQKADYAKLEQLLQTYLGVTPQDLQQQQAVVEQVRLQSERTSLKTEWGVDDDELSKRLQQVEQYWAKLPEHVQPGLNNLEGVRLIWKAISGETSAKPPAAEVPFNDRSTANAPSGTQPMFTQQELYEMDEPTYRKYADQINYAYANGLVA